MLAITKNDKRIFCCLLYNDILLTFIHLAESSLISLGSSCLQLLPVSPPKPDKPILTLHEQSPATLREQPYPNPSEYVTSNDSDSDLEDSRPHYARTRTSLPNFAFHEQSYNYLFALSIFEKSIHTCFVLSCSCESS